MCIASSDPKAITDHLRDVKKFRTGEISFHLGSDYFRGKDGTLKYEPKKYIGRMLDRYKQTFGELPQKRSVSPLSKGNHPELLDDSKLLNETDTRHYQSLIGSLQ